MDHLLEAVALGVDAVLFTICLNQYLKNKKAVKLMQDTPNLQINEELKKVLLAAPSKKLDYVAIRGSVKPIGNPIISNANPAITGVVQLLSIKEHIIQRSTAGFWTDHERVIQEVHNIIPFAVESKGVDIEIMDPLAAEILDMDIISDNFLPTSPSFMDHIIGFFSGIRQRGVQTTEKMLRKGATITGIGELVANNDGTLKLQPPVNGAPFYLTNLQLNTLIRRLDDKRSNYKVLCFVFGAIGIVLGGILVKRYWKEWKRKLDEARNKDNIRKMRKKRTPPENLPENQLCAVCKANPLEIILLPCGHVCLCEDCSDVIHDHCPLCRTVIRNKSVAYLL